MNNIRNLCLSVLVILIFSSVLAAQEKSGPAFAFDEEKHDFGDITQGEKVEYIFKFTNSGTEPLIISNVLTTCGCTAPTWPKDPIAPNGKGEIKIVFNSSGKMGKQNKVITIMSNSVNQKDRISITANVSPKS